MTLRQIDSFVDTLRSMVTLDGVSQIPQKTFELMTSFNGWMRRVAHVSRQGCIKRLEKRHFRRHEIKKVIKNRRHKCCCRKCKRKLATKNVKPDLLANMAYELRVSQEKPLIVEETIKKVSEEPKIHREGLEKPHEYTLRHRRHHRHQHQPRPHALPVIPHQDGRYLQQSDYVGQAWWTDENYQVFMPPLIQKLSLKPTRSECSSISEFRTGSPVISNHIPSLGCTSDSKNSDYKSCRDGPPSCYHLNSKSDAKIPSSPTLGKKPVGRSASMPLGQKPRELQGLQMAAKRKLEKKRPVRSTSHTTDSFSNCVKCSRIVFRSFKKMTC
ncbi:uncharacterized protein [Chelonus insularis]|uniref:uncharacterized protein n=1 Tax=Chelonus insularis TaxID=460826 RepID=UPI001589E2C1|nr:uncharacterized protein LOC118065537 [Chelonus insularis]